MSVTITSQFRFSQYYVQDDGGWCGGISTSLITHLYENLDGRPEDVVPAEAFSQAKQYINLLSGTFNKATGRAAAGTQTFRGAIRNQQRPYDIGGAGSPRGSYEYNFQTPGIALLDLIVREPIDSSHGTDFLSWYSVSLFTPSPNHAGVAAWTTDGNAFLFDPNCGGSLLKWQPSDQIQFFPQAMDLALEIMYRQHDRLRGGRAAKLLSAKRLDADAVPYGHV